METSKSKTTNRPIKTGDLLKIVRDMADGQEAGKPVPVYTVEIMEAVLGHVERLQRHLDHCELTLGIVSGSDEEQCQSILKQNREDRGE